MAVRSSARRAIDDISELHEEDGEEMKEIEISLTESRVRTKLWTSMVSVGPTASLGFSSFFFPLTMVLSLRC